MVAAVVVVVARKMYTDEWVVSRRRKRNFSFFFATSSSSPDLLVRGPFLERGSVIRDLKVKGGRKRLGVHSPSITSRQRPCYATLNAVCNPPGYCINVAGLAASAGSRSSHGCRLALFGPQHSSRIARAYWAIIVGDRSSGLGWSIKLPDTTMYLGALRSLGEIDRQPGTMFGGFVSVRRKPCNVDN